MEAHEVRMEIKRLLQVARVECPEFDFLGEVSEEDVIIEALIHPETFEISVRNRT
jgi:hypothetical protein